MKNKNDEIIEEPIRILQVVGRMDRGGIETLIMNLYRNIDRDKIQFDFLCHYGKEGDFNDEIRSLGGRIYEMPRIKTTKKTYYWKIFSYVFALIKFFKSHKEYKIIHGHMTNTAVIYMPIARLFGNVKVKIAHSHLTQSPKGMHGLITSMLHKPLKIVASDYFSCSEMAAKWIFSEKMLANGQVKILHNAIDLDKYKYNENIRNSLRHSFMFQDKLVIGNVGRFFHQKNHDFLVDIFYNIHKKNQDSILMLVGEGELMNQIQNKVSELGISESVLFLGVRSDVHELMQSMDIYVMPSHFEGLPLVGVEAQAAGLKCYFSKNITEELKVLKNTEFISLDETAEFWAEKILSDISLSKRVDTSKEVRDSGYDIKDVVNELEEFYIKKQGLC